MIYKTRCENERIVIRRKAKRIHRARIRLCYLRADIESLPKIGEVERSLLLKVVDDIIPYLQNDDFQENEYNYDNQNN